MRLQRMLGAGGMGSVWVADHLTLHTEVAVKFIAADLVTQEEALHRFTREATSAARIKNPHVVQMLDHGVYEGQPYIVMELLTGEDLADRLDRSGTLPVAEAAQILRQACKALAAAHELGIVHRDIKPANIFLTWSAGDLFVKVLDFGIAKQVGVGQPTFKTAANTMVGTPFYMSPEQVFAHTEVDHRADLWSLAVVAYQMVTGVLPFQGDTLANLYLALHQGSFRNPSDFPHVPFPALDAWFIRAFSSDPAARFGSARQFGDTFAAIARKCGRDYMPAPPELTDNRTIRRSEGLGDLLKEAEAYAASQVMEVSQETDMPTVPEARDNPSTPPLARPAPRIPRRPALVTASFALGVLVLGIAVIFLIRARTATHATESPLVASSVSEVVPASAPPAAPEPSPGAAPEPTPSTSVTVSAETVPSVETGPALTAAPSATTLTTVAPLKSAAPGFKPAVPGPGSAPKRRDHGF